MCGADLQPGEGVEGTFEYQMRQSDCRLERVAYHVLQYAVAFQPAGCIQLGNALRIDEDQHAELFGFSPERMEFLIRQLLAIDAAADQSATQSKPLDRMLELLG